MGTVPFDVPGSGRSGDPYPAPSLVRKLTPATDTGLVVAAGTHVHVPEACQILRGTTGNRGQSDDG